MGNSVGDVEWLKLAGEGGSGSAVAGGIGGASTGASRSMATGRVLHRDLKPENSECFIFGSGVELSR